MAIREVIAWRIPYNPSWLDRHEIEDGVCLVCLPTGERIWAIARDCETEVLYEPIYVTLVDEEPPIWLGDEPNWDAQVGDQVPLQEALPHAVQIRALSDGNSWVAVSATPHLALIETEEDTNTAGICIAYSLPGAELVPSWGRPNVCDALPNMMRHIYEKRGTSRQPQFFIWS